MTKTIETRSVICGSEEKFLKLLGDGSEVVKVTFGDSRDVNKLNGWWLYENSDEKNAFTRKHPDQVNYPKMVDRFFCETKGLQFDMNLGICPNCLYYDYSPLGENNSEERDAQIEKLKARGMWRE